MVTNSGTDGNWQGPNGERPKMRGKPFFCFFNF